MFRQGFLQEVKNLRASGLSWDRIEEFGFEYRLVVDYLHKNPSFASAKDRPLQTLKQQIQKATEDFARRQMTWFKKDQRVNWITSSKDCEAFLKQYLG